GGQGGQALPSSHPFPLTHTVHKHIAIAPASTIPLCNPEALCPRGGASALHKPLFLHGWGQTTAPVVLECIGRLRLIARESVVNRAISYSMSAREFTG